MINLRNPKRIKLFYGYRCSGYQAGRNIWPWYEDVNYFSIMPMVIHFSTHRILAFDTITDYRRFFMNNIKCLN